MKIQRMRLVLPARMRNTAQSDAREIAQAVARTLNTQDVVNGPINIRIKGHGRPAVFLARDVSRALVNRKGRG